MALAALSGIGVGLGQGLLRFFSTVNTLHYLVLVRVGQRRRRRRILGRRRSHDEARVRKTGGQVERTRLSNKQDVSSLSSTSVVCRTRITKTPSFLFGRRTTMWLLSGLCVSRSLYCDQFPGRFRGQRRQTTDNTYLSL